MNVVALVGRLTKDPELKFIPGSGKAVANFTLAVDNPFDKDNADFLRIVVWGKTAESVGQYKKKGDRVGVRGRISTRTYEAVNGETKYVTEIIADNVEFMGGKGEGQALNAKPAKVNVPKAKEVATQDPNVSPEETDILSMIDNIK